MKIFSAAQIKACEAFSMQEQSVSSLDLMERAARAAADWIEHHFSRSVPFLLLCGCGNNGGDGMALTRILRSRGYAAQALLFQYSESLSPNAQENLNHLRKINPEVIQVLSTGAFFSDIPSETVLIDALWGIGLNRPIRGWMADIINLANSLPCHKIALDIPSGLPADQLPAPGSPTFSSQETLTFQFYKRTMLHKEAYHLTGTIHLLEIGLSSRFIDQTPTQFHLTDQVYVQSLYRRRHPFSHKGTYGTAMLTGGSKGMAGALYFSLKGALKAGAGKVYGQLCEVIYPMIQIHLPEAISFVSGKEYITKITSKPDVNAVGIGPGLGTHADTAVALFSFLGEYKKPVVLDADALNILAGDPEKMRFLPKNSVLTPHPKEFNRLFGSSEDSIGRVEQARQEAMRYNCTIVLKGHHTIIVHPETGCFYNSTGNSGLATAGTGDVLMGMITGLLAQGYEPQIGSILATYIHGLAADLALKRESEETLIASDLFSYLGQAFDTIGRRQDFLKDH